MKTPKLLYLTLLLALLLSACGSVLSTPEPIPTITLDSNIQAESSSPVGSAVITASGIAVPTNTVQLSFPLVGSVVEILVDAGDTVNAGDTLVQLDTAILQANINEAEANVIAAETQVSYLRRITESSNENILAAEAEVDRQSAILDAARERLDQATLIAPIGGTVASVNISLGETVTPGLIVISVGDLSKMQVETTDLSERDVPEVKIGQSATIYIDALDQETSGVVTRIAEQASSIGGDVVYKVTLSLDKTPPELRWGMSAEVKISVGE